MATFLKKICSLGKPYILFVQYIIYVVSVISSFGFEDMILSRVCQCLVIAFLFLERDNALKRQ